MSARLTIALETGGLVLPDAGTISVLHPPADFDLSPFALERVQVVQPFRPDHDYFRQLGYECVPVCDAPCAAALVCLPRSKALARAMVHAACVRSDGLVIVDGFKTGGIDSLLKDIRKRVDVTGPLSKAHGKIFWFPANAEAFTDWAAPVIHKVDGYTTAPGVFSADGVDPASALLVSALPQKLGSHVVDLGAGWGYLSAHLAKDNGFTTLDLVEADYSALDCARRNVTDPRARFHWADAASWKPETRVDTVVMNPPFHVGRAADPSLGRAFIATAARILAPSGGLWLVANRHLPYETTLGEQFIKVEEVAGDRRFKVLHAARPKRAKPTRTRR